MIYSQCGYNEIKNKLIMTAAASLPTVSTQTTHTEARVTIVTDSVAQVPDVLASELGIRIIPLSVMVEDKKYIDGIDLDPEGLYQRMRLEKDLRISTSAPSAGQFYALFLDCLQQGAQSVLYIGLTSHLSGTFSAAEGGALMAREEFNDRQIVVYDSRLATIAQGFLAIEAARLAGQGASVEQILEQLEQERKRIGFAAGLETLEYLARGGRIGKAAYMLGSLVQILPVVTLSEDGEVLPISRVRGYHHVLEEIIRYVSQKVTGCSRLTLAVMHADADSWADELQRLANERLHPDEIFVTPFTPVMAAHAGPGMIGLAYHWRP